MNLLATIHKESRCLSSDASPNSLRGFLWIALLLSSVALSGCATPALWKHTAARNWHPEPSGAQFLVANAAGQQDVIVVFRQSTVVGERIKYRVVAWNLRHPPSELAIGRKAVQQLTNACDQVRVMPSFCSDSIAAGATSTSPGYAVLEPLPCRFIVHLEGSAPGPFELPSSREKTRSAMRVVGLPLAVAADGAIVCAAAMAIGGQAYH